MAQLKKPTAFDTVYRDECMFGFDTPEAAEGLYVNMKTHQAYGVDFVDLDRERTGQTTYLNIKWKRIPKKKAADDGDEAKAGDGDEAKAGDEPAKPEVTKFAIGVEGGFELDEDQWEYEKTYSIVEFPAKTATPFPSDAVPAEVAEVADAIINHQDASVEDNPSNVWEEKLEVSIHSLELVQLDNGKRISPDPKSWKCEACDKTDNLWLNLSDGYIGCGRRQLDGSGGNNHALNHFTETGNVYPLCVKLGTITAKGADVYSYAPEENDMVENPKLAEHLQHWGIQMMTMEKTEKSMAEANIELNLSFEFSTILEVDGTKLKPAKGAGFVGLRNLGNSCYMNSCLQVLLSLPEFRARYFDPAAAIFKGAAADPAKDVVAQTAKVAVGVLSDKYVNPPPTSDDEKPKDDEVAPTRFRALIGRGHPDFSTGAQQDAQEYFGYLLEKLSRAERTATDPGHAVGDVSKLFEAQVESKLKCSQSGKVRYTTTSSSMFCMGIPVEAATNTAEVEAYIKEESAKRQKGEDGAAAAASAPPRVVPSIPFEAVLERFTADAVIDGWVSPATGVAGTAVKRTRFATFPRYLTIQLARYVQAEDWTVKKLEAVVPMPEKLDLTALRGTGLQAGEEELPEAAPAAAAAAAPEPSPAIVAELTGMGFSENAAKRAALACENANSEVAANWLFQHMEDADINDPLPAPEATVAASSGTAEPSSELISMITAMGFSETVAKFALGETSNNAERAVDWLFSHTDDIPAIEAGTYGAPAAAAAAAAAAGAAAGAGAGAGGPAAAADGPGKYTLVGIISHIGRNTGSGHYVAHVRKDGKWYLFNDSKVAESLSPPLGHGYMYVYSRDE